MLLFCTDGDWWRLGAAEAIRATHAQGKEFSSILSKVDQKKSIACKSITRMPRVKTLRRLFQQLSGRDSPSLLPFSVTRPALELSRVVDKSRGRRFRVILGVDRPQSLSSTLVWLAGGWSGPMRSAPASI